MSSYRNPKTGKNQALGPHAPTWCPEMLKSGAIPELSLDAPHFLHMVSSSGIILDNITITTSPSWTLHFQYLLRGINMS